jgi:hypothetical protein
MQEFHLIAPSKLSSLSSLVSDCTRIYAGIDTIFLKRQGGSYPEMPELSQALRGCYQPNDMFGVSVSQPCMTPQG